MLPQSNRIADYLDTVRRQIRWKKAQNPVLEEIQNHLLDQKDAFIRDGDDEETAVLKAIAEMGDPVVIGSQLDRAHRPKADWPLLGLTAILILLGLFIQFMIGTDSNSGMEMFHKQVIWSALAVIVLLAAYFLDYTILGKHPLLICFLLMTITLGDYWFSSIRGYGYTAIYPLLLFPAVFAGFVYRMRNERYAGLALCGAVVIAVALLILRIHNMTALFLIMISCLTILTIAIAKGWFNVRKVYALLATYLSCAALCSVIFFRVLNQGYAHSRLEFIFKPWLEPTGVGYMGTLIQRFLLNSRLVGEGAPVVGYGQLPAAEILPAANTDFVLTYLIYKFGWVLFIAIILVFAAFIARSAIISKKQKNALGQLVSLAIIVTFAVQLLTFIASNLGFLLFSPLSLPLISYGGRALLVNMCLIGFMLSVFRTGSLTRDNVQKAWEKPSHLIQYEDGKIIINLKATP